MARDTSVLSFTTITCCLHYIASVLIIKITRDAVEFSSMKFSTEDNQSYKYGLILAYFVGCIVFHVGASFFSILIEGFKTLESRWRREWYNRLTATTHASTLFIFSLYYWLYLGDSTETEILEWNKICVDIMLGYLMYDTSHELFINTLTNKDKPDVLTIAHHVMGAISLGSARFLDCHEAMRLQMFIFLAECSTPFLHVGWLLYQFNISPNDSNTFIFTSFFLLSLFFSFRVVLGPILVYHTVYEASMFSRFPELYYLNVFIVVGFTLLNFFWFYALVAMFFKPSKTGKKTDSETLKSPTPIVTSETSPSENSGKTKKVE